MILTVQIRELAGRVMCQCQFAHDKGYKKRPAGRPITV